MKSLFLIFAALALTCATTQSDQNLIRSLRDLSNDAIAAQDLDALASTWRDDIQVTISSGTHLDGAEAYRNAFAGAFESVPGINFVRKTTKVEVNEDGTVASEHGHWTGYYPNQAVTVTSGEYMACWRLTDGEWLISAELYVPTNQSP